MKILIAVPTYENITPDTFKSIYGLDRGGNHCVFDFIRGYDVATARNRIGSQTIAENADYSKLGIKSGWWSELDGCPEVEVTASGYYEVTLSADALSVMNEKNGMIVVGNGVYVDKVTIE